MASEPSQSPAKPPLETTTIILCYSKTSPQTIQPKHKPAINCKEPFADKRDTVVFCLCYPLLRLFQATVKLHPAILKPLWLLFQLQLAIAWKPFDTLGRYVS